MQKNYLAALVISLLPFQRIMGQQNKNEITLRPDVAFVLRHLEAIRVFDGKDDLDISRKSYESMAFQLGEKKEMVTTIDEVLISFTDHAIPVRIYRPLGHSSAKSPAIIYLHGGWFISGGFETHDSIARKLANAAQATIIFPDYRLAPEHPFPAGLEDARYIVNWVVDNARHLGVDAASIGIAGDSAGGALAAAITSQLGNKLQFQVLIYPAADNSLATKSWEKYSDGPVLSKTGGEQAWKWYLQKAADRQDPLAIPLLINTWKNVPPTLVLLAEHDPLHDEGLQLAGNITDSGSRGETVLYKDMVHGFLHMSATLPEAHAALEQIAAFIKNQNKNTR